MIALVSQALDPLFEIYVGNYDVDVNYVSRHWRCVGSLEPILDGRTFVRDTVRDDDRILHYVS